MRLCLRVRLRGLFCLNITGMPVGGAKGPNMFKENFGRYANADCGFGNGSNNKRTAYANMTNAAKAKENGP